MPHPRLTNEEIARLGEKIYAARLRSVLEKEHHGEVVIIDVGSGEYEIGRDSLAANQRALAKHPGAALYGIRVGSNVVESINCCGEYQRSENDQTIIDSSLNTSDQPHLN